MPQRLLTWLAVGLAAGLAAFPARAQVNGLAELGDWYQLDLDWRTSTGLPADTEFVGPLAAAYNWAYGATVLGVNVRVYGTDQYYMAMAVVVNDALETLDTVGPLTAPARLDCGPYHVAAGLPDGRLLVWLTAPHSYPQYFVFTNYYQADTGFDFAVYPPQPVDTTWANWWVTGAYQYNVFEPSLVVSSTDGAGAARNGLSALALPSDLRSLAYIDYPLPGTSAPYLLYSLVRDRNIELGNNDHITAHSAWFSQQNGWYTANLRGAGLYAGDAVLLPGTNAAGAAAPVGLLAYDESDASTVVSSIQFIQPTSPDGASLQTSLGQSAALPVVANLDNVNIFASTRSNYPLLAVSDGTDIYLGYYSRQGARGIGAPYVFTRLQQGDTVPSGATDVTAYPIQAVAATAHWSTGNPEVFWVQRGNPNNQYGTLYRLAYRPPTVRPAT